MVSNLQGDLMKRFSHKNSTSIDDTRNIEFERSVDETLPLWVIVCLNIHNLKSVGNEEVNHVSISGFDDMILTFFEFDVSGEQSLVVLGA